MRLPFIHDISVRGRFSHPVGDLAAAALVVNEGTGSVERVVSQGPRGSMCSDFLVYAKVTQVARSKWRIGHSIHRNMLPPLPTRQCSSGCTPLLPLSPWGFKPTILKRLAPELYRIEQQK